MKMVPKERLVRFKDLLRILAREHDLGEKGPSVPSFYRTAVLQESWTLLELLGTIEGFLSDERLGLVGEDVRQFDAAKNVLRAWMSAARQGTLTPQDAQRFSQRVTMIIAKTTETLDQLLTALDAESQERNRVANREAQSFGSSLSNYGQRQTTPWYQNLMRVAVLSIAPLIAGCVPGERASAQEPGNPTINTTVTNPQQGRDYVREFRDSLNSVKIVDGKDAGWYNSEGFKALKEKRMHQAAGNFYKAIELSPQSYSNYSSLGTVYYRMADASANAGEKKAYLEQSLSLYETARRKAEVSQNTDEDKKEILRGVYTSLAFVNNSLGHIVDAKDFLSLARKMGGLSPKANELANTLGLR